MGGEDSDIGLDVEGGWREGSWKPLLQGGRG